MIAQSQSGTGKTAAFALTILSRINYDLHAPQVTIALLLRGKAIDGTHQVLLKAFLGNLPLFNRYFLIGFGLVAFA